MARVRGYEFDPKDMISKINQAATKSEAAISMYADNAALTLQNYAREHRPWTDRTGHARQRLTGSAEVVSQGYRIVLAHGVDYGVWLELAHEKKYAIIQPTIQAKSPEVLSGFNKLLERLS